MERAKLFQTTSSFQKSFKMENWLMGFTQIYLELLRQEAEIKGKVLEDQCWNHNQRTCKLVAVLAFKNCCLSKKSYSTGYGNSVRTISRRPLCCRQSFKNFVVKAADIGSEPKMNLRCKEIMKISLTSRTNNGRITFC
jgi:hypothetical protein